MQSKFMTLIKGYLKTLKSNYKIKIKNKNEHLNQKPTLLKLFD